MFLIRTAFWLTLVILLLPTDEQDQRNVYGTAEAAVNDLKTFCERNPGVCEKSGEALDIFAQKAKFGAKMVMDFVTDASAEGDNANANADADRPRRFPTLFNRNSQNTLTPQDMEPGWFGKSPGPKV